jgi:hypothetical protein
MATVRVRIVILTVRITLSVCPFNRMAHTANSHGEMPSPNYAPNPTLEITPKSIKKRFLARAPRIEQQKQNCCASDRPWQRSIWPNATTNQQSRGTSLSIKIIANSLCNFISVDCCLVASFLNLVKNTTPWPC